jgi:EAL domain-containing protein (putative c-di-GMP-specific phosphodiesterase class I)
LFEAVVEALQRSGLAASRLHLELPVAALRSDDRQIAAMIEQLRGLGVQIWLDVVGADAADQSRWMKMSVTGVKVGRSRIAGKPDDAADRAATGAIVATAHALRVVAVVVGVEELEQLDLLRAQGADLAQGYVLCKPVDTAEIGRRLLA